MPHFLARVVLHGATEAEYTALHGFMEQEGLQTWFKTSTHIHHMPPATYYRRSLEELFQVKDRVVRALAHTRFVAGTGTGANGTYAHFVIGPSVSAKYEGLRKERLTVPKAAVKKR